LWLRSFPASPIWATAIGIVWLLGRLAYALGSYKSADARRIPLYVGMPPIYVLVLGALIGFALKAVKGRPDTIDRHAERQLIRRDAADSARVR